MHAPDLSAIQVRVSMRGVLKIAPILCMYSILKSHKPFVVYEVFFGSFRSLPSLAFYPGPACACWKSQEPDEGRGAERQTTN